MYQEIARDRQPEVAAGLAARLLQEETAIAARRSRALRVGETFLLRRAAEYPVEWLVVEQEDRRARVVLLDEHPFVGSHDLALTGRAPGVLRCDFVGWLALSELEPELCTGMVARSEVEAFGLKRRAIEEGTLEVSLVEEDVDGDSDYRWWREQMLRPALAALLEAEVGREKPAIKRRAVGRLPFGWAELVAAGLWMGVVVFLLWQGMQMRRQLEGQQVRLATLEGERQVYAGRLAASQSVVERLESELRAEKEASERALAEHEERSAARLRRVLETSVVANVPAFLLASVEREGARRGQAKVLVPGEAARFILALELAEPDPDRRYRLRIVEKASGEEVWSTDGMKVVSRKWLRLDLPVALFDAQEYEILINGSSFSNDSEDRYLIRLGL